MKSKKERRKPPISACQAQPLYYDFVYEDGALTIDNDLFERRNFSPQNNEYLRNRKG